MSLRRETPGALRERIEAQTFTASVCSAVGVSVEQLIICFQRKKVKIKMSRNVLRMFAVVGERY